jgi:Na+/H+ antiporter NhaC
MEDYSILSIVPPVLSIFLAVYTRNIIISLTLGTLSGTLILTNYNPFFAIVSLMEDHIFVQVSNPSNTQVILITLIIGGFVGILEYSGGAKAFSSMIVKFISNPMRGQLAAWISGLSIFFTDTGNSLIVGPLFRPVFHELKICREKLAYIIDTTAAPVTILIPVASWGVYIMSLIENSYRDMGIEGDAFSVLLAVWPYQFYALLAVISVPMIVMTGKDFGLMAKAQRQYIKDEKEGIFDEIKAEIQESEQPKLIMVILPFSVMAISLITIIGYFAFNEGVKSVHVNSGLCISYILASIGCAYVMKRYQNIAINVAIDQFFKGMGQLISVAAILALAWALSSICRDLHTGEYLATLVGDHLDPRFFPVVVFFIGALMSFATGSSYGTFAILMATTLPVAQILDADLVLCIAAILSGGLFGDHTSPISDTTVLASMGAGCPHIDHVSTQFVYASLTGFLTVIAFIFVAFYPSVWVITIMIIVQFFAIRLMMRFFGSEIAR